MKVKKQRNRTILAKPTKLLSESEKSEQFLKNVLGIGKYITNYGKFDQFPKNFGNFGKIRSTDYSFPRKSRPVTLLYSVLVSH